MLIICSVFRGGEGAGRYGDGLLYAQSWWLFMSGKWSFEGVVEGLVEHRSSQRREQDMELKEVYRVDAIDSGSTSCEP